MDSNEYFGSKAGAVWGAMNNNKPMNAVLDSLLMFSLNLFLRF